MTGKTLEDKFKQWNFGGSYENLKFFSKGNRYGFNGRLVWQSFLKVRKDLWSSLLVYPSIERQVVVAREYFEALFGKFSGHQWRVYDDAKLFCVLKLVLSLKAREILAEAMNASPENMKQCFRNPRWMDRLMPFINGSKVLVIDGDAYYYVLAKDLDQIVAEIQKLEIDLRLSQSIRRCRSLCAGIIEFDNRPLKLRHEIDRDREMFKRWKREKEQEEYLQERGY